MYINQCYYKDKTEIPKKSTLNSDDVPKLRELLTRLKRNRDCDRDEITMC